MPRKVTKDLIVELKCFDHPKYTGGRRAPTENCVVCWKIYASNLAEKVKEYERRQAAE